MLEKVNLQKLKTPSRIPVWEQVDELCKYLADHRESRMSWFEIIDEFRDWYDFLDSVESTSQYTNLDGKSYLNLFIDAHRDKNNALVKDALGAISEGMVYHLLNDHSESKGKTEREVYVEVTTDREFWSSKNGKRKTLDVAFWDSVKNQGRGFECKIADVKRDVCTAVVELLSTIHGLTDGQFEMVLFSFCLDSNALREALSRNISEQDKTRLSTICFIGTNHLASFDGTTSCCGEFPQSPFNNSPLRIPNP